MDHAPVDPLFVALRDGGFLSATKVAEAERAFVECGRNPADLAERLNALGALTRYQYKKLQVGRAADLLFGPYLILDKIGEGGMGKVYRAKQLRTNRLVALKVVRPQLMANKTVVKRYEREAAAAAKLDHPNIVKLYDAELADGRYYLAMEYVEGLDLAKLVKQFGPLPYQEAAEYMRQAALGLQHAHDQSLIHRDIKPSNLLVHGERALPGTSGKAFLKLLDMGLVRSSLEEDVGPDLTRDGTVVGTPDYMSPEQAKNSSTVTAQADIYSLGCTLYYLLCARPPYPDGTPVEKLIKHQLDPFPDIRKLVPGVPSGLARVIADMTAKRLSDRIATADRVAAAVAPFTGTVTDDAFDLFAPTPRTARTDRTGPPSAAPAAEVVAAAAVAADAGAVARTPSATQTPAARGGQTAQPRSVRTKAIPKPEPDPLSAESLPSGDTRKSPRTGTTANPGTVRVKKPRSGKLVGKTEKPFPFALVIGCVLAAAAAVVLVLLAFQKPPAPPPADAPKPVEQPPPPPPVEVPTLRPIDDLLADHTVGVLIAHPKAYFDRYALEPNALKPLTKALDRLRNRFLFDPRKMERVVVSFTAAPRGFAVAGEGGGYKADWFASLDTFPASKVKVTADTGGAKRLEFPLPVQPKNPFKKETLSDGHGGALPGPPVAFFLADHADTIARLVRRNNDRPADRGPATDIPPALTVHLREAAPKAPLFHFAAAGGFRLPSKPGGAVETLNTFGVSLLTADARLTDKQVEIDLTVTGNRLTDVRDFLNVELPRRLEEWHDSLKPLADALKVEPQTQSVGGRTKMTLSVKVEWAAVQAAVEALVTPYQADPLR